MGLGGAAFGWPPPRPWLPDEILYGAGLPWVRVYLFRGLPSTWLLGYTAKLRLVVSRGAQEDTALLGRLLGPLASLALLLKGATTTLVARPPTVPQKGVLEGGGRGMRQGVQLPASPPTQMDQWNKIKPALIPI